MKLHQPTILFALVGLLLSLGASAEQGDAGQVHIPGEEGEDGQEITLYQGGSYALLIGASDYVNWPDLPGVMDDLDSVRKALDKQGFEVTEVPNPDHAQLRRAFDDFISTHGDAEENRLLFYFAGHGHTLELAYGAEMGYIVPVDAPNPTFDRRGFQAKALDMQQITVYARRIESRHALFLFDSCFSGSIFALSRAAPEHISYKVARPVRQFITAGSAGEEVPDESIFRAQFVAALNGEADLTGDGYVTGAELGMFLQDKVVNYSNGSQHPQYGKIRDPRLDKGDFVFQLAEGAVPATKPAAPSSETEPATAAREAAPDKPDESRQAPDEPDEPRQGPDESDKDEWSWYEWLSNWSSKEWIFSGIGTAIVMGILGWVLKRLRWSHTRAAGPHPSPQEAPGMPHQEDQPSPGDRIVQGGNRSVNIRGRADSNVFVTGDRSRVGKDKQDE